jgi:hypothetical protein
MYRHRRVTRPQGGTHKVNAGLTLLLPITPTGVAATRQLLTASNKDQTRLPFDHVWTTHFATITIIPAQEYGFEPLPITLLFATSFSGPVEDHVRELVQVMAPRLREVFRHCEGFVFNCSDALLAEFILENRQPDTFYSGMQHLSRKDVLQHRYLRDELETYLDTHQASLPASARAIQRDLQTFVRSRDDLAWADQPFAPPRSAWLALYWRSLIVLAIAVPFLVALVVCSLLAVFVPEVRMAAAVLGIIFGGVVVTIGGMLLAVRQAEQEQTFVAGRQPDADVRTLAAMQNLPVINQFTIAGPVKEGYIRPLFLRLAMWVVARLAEGVPKLYTAINIPTVATARWIPADRGRRLIFISNYTNAAEPYVRDFIDAKDGAKNINLTFGFGRGYPKTEWIMGGGALTDPNGFIYVVTANQYETHFWYGPYRDMSIDNIKLNRKIREGLFADHDEEQAQKWLHLL